MAYFASRLLQSIVVMLVVTLAAFYMFQYVGDPVQSMSTEEATPEYRAQLRESLGLNDPIVVQFIKYLSRVAQGDFGVSLRNSYSVRTLLAERLPATVELVACATAIGIAFGLPLGIYTSIHRRSGLSQLIQALSLTGVSLPSFVIGILLILVFSVWLGWLPSYGRGDVVQLGWWSTGFLTMSGVKALILPSITLGVFQLTLVMNLIRGEYVTILRSDYIKFARARGIPSQAINLRYALKSALVPVITIVGMQVGSLIAFAVVTETVFRWPGMGTLFMQAVSFGDVPVMSAYLLLIALMFVAINFIADISYYIIDPRLRSEG
jgi:peptide/nickel transport system permease protein